MSLSAALKWRYATKKFDPNRTVSEPLLDALLESANLSATSYGLQPFQFVVLRNQELQEQLVTSSYGQRQVADASHLIVIATRTDVDDDYIRGHIELMETGLELPTGSLDRYETVMAGAIGGMSPEYRQQWAANQAYIALGTLLAACATLEIDSCPMEGFVPEEYNQLLDLTSRNLHAAVVLPIGYRAADDETQRQAKIRRPISDMAIRL